MIHFAMSFFLLTASLSLSFDDLSDAKAIEQADGSSVRMRGFLYHKDDGTWILAAQPDVRSCCVGSKENAQRQVIVQGNILKDNYLSVVALEGTFKSHPNFYVLSDASFIDSSHTQKPIATFIVIGLVGVCLSLWYYRKKMGWFKKDI